MLAGLLAAVMVISLAACGNRQSDRTATQSNGAKAQAEQIVLRWNEVNGDGYGATEGAKAFKAKLEEVSGGAMTIDLFTNGTLGDEKESMQGIQMGTLDIFRGNASSLPNYGAETIACRSCSRIWSSLRRWRIPASVRKCLIPWTLLIADTLRSAGLWKARARCLSRRKPIKSLASPPSLPWI